MIRRYPHLFDQITIRGFTFRNRIIGAPVGAWVFSPDNYMFDYAIDMWEEKAAGGAAAVTVGHTEVNYGEMDSDHFGLYFNLRDRKGMAALTEFASAVRQHGAHVSVELNYGGIPPKDPSPGVYYAPSAYITDCGVEVQEMTEEKIAETVAQYADCAKKLKQAGFDMVTIHGAHGWLPQQFLSPKTNHRKDRFGGSLENRMRFPIMIIEAIREVVGEDMLIEYRINGMDPDRQSYEFEETIEFIHAIEHKIDLLHVSAGGNEHIEDLIRNMPSYLMPRALNADWAGAIKARVRVPVAVVGAITEPEDAEAIIASGKADFVALARGLIADPEWCNKARRGQAEDIIPCIGCYRCLSHMHKTHQLACSVNARTGREHRIPRQTTASQKKKVVVIGGGPAGMQAACTATDRGHDVILFEKTDSLGGLLKISANNPIKVRLDLFRQYLIRQVEKRNIQVKYKTEATPDLVEAEQADAVIVALGSIPLIPQICGVDNEHVMTAMEAHASPDLVGARVAVVGGNLVGCEAALHMLSLGKTVSLIEMTDSIHQDAVPEVAAALDYHLAKGVIIYAGAKCTNITPDGAEILLKKGIYQFIPADTIILAAGMKPLKEESARFLNCAPDVIVIGDCTKAATVYEATHQGYFAALDI